jgi:hypothetical protein
VPAACWCRCCRCRFERRAAATRVAAALQRVRSVSQTPPGRANWACTSALRAEAVRSAALFLRLVHMSERCGFSTSAASAASAASSAALCASRRFRATVRCLQIFSISAALSCWWEAWTSVSWPTPLPPHKLSPQHARTRARLIPGVVWLPVGLRALHGGRVRHGQQHPFGWPVPGVAERS